MSRHTFFSFHYQRDVQRAAVVRNSWVCKRDRVDAGFFENGLWEKAKQMGGSGIRRIIGSGMKGTSVTCLCIGHETWSRYWVRYELLKSFAEGKGILGIRIHGIQNFKHQVDEPGYNPLDYLAFRCEPRGVRLLRKFNGVWAWSEEFPNLIPWDSVAYDLGGCDYHTFSTLFPVYDWSHSGHDALGGWIESAARYAGR
ncbi:MAG TPA: TIR domain-containing protein [Thermoanaerobaculia bacterium]|nr:TIR domain-containing protein [Thermoanaerobaculia bacterium]